MLWHILLKKKVAVVFGLLYRPGALVGLIYVKTIESPSIAYDNDKAITLMNTDADSLDRIAEMVYEMWAQGFSLSKLAGYGLFHFFLFIISNPTQSLDMMLSLVIVKMIGLQYSLTHQVQQLRKEELWVASKLRWVMVYYNASGQ
ncbi:hypothetical protein BOTNAR_0006g00170 [Botryotinia narcissicola]|uniref:Uncharacterized protein n=1 Tax=Botryotinia narcissicola TaxID=278944 RepID=A0A4Z1J859_9HELO|nr:hypothetical protein BOTNAR_0006g00170 [Botryotinia narcissicola]